MTKDALLKVIEAYKGDKLIREWIEPSVDAYSEALLQQTHVIESDGITKEQVKELYMKLGKAYDSMANRLEKAIELDVDASVIDEQNRLVDEAETLYKAIISL